MGKSKAKEISIVVKDLPKRNGMDTANLYILNAPVFYASVLEPKLNYAKDGKEYSVTIFVDEATKDKLLDEVLVNKVFSKVGVDKTSKPPRRIKYPLSSQVEEGKVNYDVVDGLYGFQVAKNEFSKKGNPMTVNVIDTEGEEFTENIGNGSVCTFKLFGYRNQDEQLVVSLDTVQVVAHVPYEGKSASDSVEDEVMGVSYKVQKPNTTSESNGEAAPSQEKEAPANKEKAAVAPDDDFEDDIPF